MSAVLRRIVVDDTDPAIQYGPNGWYAADPAKLNSVGNYGPVYNISSHATSTNGSTLSFPFNGTSISVMGTTATVGNADPTWDCFVDDIKIDNPSPNFQYQENNWLLCDQAQIAPGPHMLRIEVQSKGQPFYLDNILYTPVAGVSYESAVLEYTNIDPSVSFGSGWKPLLTENITQTAGAQVALNFHGTSVSLLGYIPTELPHTASAATYSIDGGPPVNFTLNGLPAQSATVYNAVLFTTNTLTPTTHNIVVTYGGDTTKTPLVVSTFYVTNTSTPATGAPNSTPSGSDSSNTPVTKTKSTPTAAIAAGTVSVVVVLALIVGLVFWCRRRRRRSADQLHRQSANPFMGSTVDTAPASLSTAAATYSYSVVPGETFNPYGQPGMPATPGTPGRPYSPYLDASPSASGVAHPYMHPAPPRAPTSATGSSHAFTPSAGSAGEAGMVYPTPVPSDGGSGSGRSGRSQKYERELAASIAMSPPAPLMPLTPLRANAPRPIVVHHQDSGVRLTPPPSIMSEPEIVDVPPGYSRD
ncbi:hypothetical protein B0H17DRAFT_1045133 [Mycena rosella]|uniref:Transmembrane protein n=1 Tax=Mycena rosella TaxID=1033263 RepID=A0AAD7DY23_MYCRO|nr:hypothetical protein B0H17DRAFT_1045133 [Mycena rosella]